MKKINVLLLFVSLILCWGCSKNHVEPENFVKNKNVEAPKFSLKDVNGALYSFPLKNEKPTLIVFWASWCVPCVKEIPHVIELQKKCGNKLEILGLSVDKDEEHLKKFVTERNIPYKILLDTNAMTAKKYGYNATPYLVLVDSKNRVRFKTTHIDQEFNTALKTVLSE